MARVIKEELGGGGMWVRFGKRKEKKLLGLLYLDDYVLHDELEENLNDYSIFVEVSKKD